MAAEDKRTFEPKEKYAETIGTLTIHHGGEKPLRITRGQWPYSTEDAGIADALDRHSWLKESKGDGGGSGGGSDGSGGPNATEEAIKLAADLGVDIATVKGTGENGRVLKGDVEQAGAGGSGDTDPAQQGGGS